MRGIRSAGAGLVIALGALSQVPAQASTACARVLVEHTHKTLTTSVGAREIRATGATCAQARQVARKAAKWTLERGVEHVPTTIDGFRVKIDDSACATCAPRWPATATKQGARVTFVLLGGD
jgi:hypothetical protein